MRTVRPFAQRYLTHVLLTSSLLPFYFSLILLILSNSSFKLWNDRFAEACRVITQSGRSSLPSKEQT